MNKYLFLLDEVPPTKSANGICADKIMCVLAVSEPVFCLAWNAKTVQDSRGYRSICIPRKPWVVKTEKYKMDKSRKGKIRFLLARVCYWIKRFFMLCVWPVDSLVTARNYYSAAVQIIEQEKITHVVGICFPGDSLLACKWLKKRYGKKIKTFIFPMDITLQGRCDGSRIERLLSRVGARAFLKNCSRDADKLLVLENAEQLYRKVFSESRQKNFAICGIPLLEGKMLQSNMPQSLGSELHCVFAGNLFYDLRNPTVLLDYLEQCRPHGVERIVFDLFGVADERILKKWEDRYRFVKLVIHGWVSETQLNTELRKADVLINVGNTQDHLIPSKLFKYMSTGKPILHQYTSSGDPCIPYLKKYGCALLVDARSGSAEMQQENKIEHFLKERKCNEEILSNLFPRCTPAYVAGVIKGENQQGASV